MTASCIVLVVDTSFYRSVVDSDVLLPDRCGFLMCSVISPGIFTQSRNLDVLCSVVFSIVYGNKVT